MKYTEWQISDIVRRFRMGTNPLDWLPLCLPRQLKKDENIASCLRFCRGSHESVFLFLSACILLTDNRNLENTDSLLLMEEKYFPHSLPEPLKVLFQYHWRLAAVPVTGIEEKYDGFYPLLCGYAEGENLCRIYVKQIAEESKEQLYKINELLPGNKIFLSLHFSSPTPDREMQESGLKGESLGLPAYLALRAALENKNTGKVYATGRINETGQIDAVGGVPRKLKQCPPYPLICPPDNDPSDKCIPLSNLDDAFAAYTNSENIGLWQRAFSSEPAQILYDLEKYPKNILDYIADSPHYEWTSPDFGKALTTLWDEILRKKKKKDKLIDFIYRLKENKKELPANGNTAYCIEQIICEKNIREGNPEAAVFFNNETPPEFDDHCYRDEVKRLEMHYHNNFLFPEQLELSADIKRDFDFFSSGTRKIKGIGDIYGFMGQNSAYRGEYEKAMRHFDKADTFFYSPDDKLQTASFRFFCEQDAFPCSQKADSLLIQLVQNAVPVENSSMLSALRTEIFLPSLIEKTNAFDADPFLFLAICRFISELPVKTLKQIDLTPFLDLSPENKKYPWNLIYYNLGKICLLRDYTAEGKQFLEQSKALCAEKNCGHTIRIMELLPLSLLCQHTISKDDSSEVLLLRDSALRKSPEHFAVLNNVANAEDVLALVRTHLKRLFPFNYR